MLWVRRAEDTAEPFQRCETDSVRSTEQAAVTPVDVQCELNGDMQQSGSKQKQAAREPSQQ